MDTSNPNDNPNNFMLKHCDVQPQYVYESTIHPQNLLSTLNEQRKLGLLCDITVIVEGTELLAHKAVLAACSTYFSGIITDPANVSHNIVLELSSITRVGMENLLEFAYTSKLTVSKANIDHVLTAARELEMKNLEYSCLDFLKQKLLQESAESCMPSQCTDSKSVCKNSTISRKLVSCVKTENMLSSDSPQSNCGLDKNVARSSSGNCPSISQLSLEPKPSLTTQNSLVSNSFLLSSTKNSQAFIKSLTGISTLSKTEQPALFSTIFSQQPCEKPEAVLKMMSLDAQPNSDSQFFCLPRDRLPSTCTQSKIDLPCKAKFTCSTSCNSDTDEVLSGDEEMDRSYKCSLSVAEFTCKSKKFPDVELPLTVEEITKLPRSELQELLNKHPHLSVQQISAMNEIRRRGKNRIAAQRCRKRKMDCIRALQCDLEVLHKEYNELMSERRCVRDNMFNLLEVFKQRYAQIFCNVLNQCEPLNNNPLNSSSDNGSCVDQAIVSMAKFFKTEIEQATKVAEQLNKLSYTNLPPLNLSCGANPDIVVVCDEEEKPSSFGYKACSPGMSSTTSFSSDVTDSAADAMPMQNISCSNSLFVQQHCMHPIESADEFQQINNKSSETASDVLSNNCDIEINTTTT